jgi:DNA-binding response OmpR family regulator
MTGAASEGVLVLSADQRELNLIAFLCKEEGHHVRAAWDLQSALSSVENTQVDLAIVDGGKSGVDGVALCRAIRRMDPYVPLLLIADSRDEDAIVRGFQEADDYLTKPLAPKVFLAHVSALLRRAGRAPSPTALAGDISAGSISLEMAARDVRVNKHRVALTPREFFLLHALMSNADRVLTREQLIRLAWGDNFVGVSKAVDVYIQRLRRKLEPHGGRPYIYAVRGIGYSFRAGEPLVAGGEQAE